MISDIRREETDTQRTFTGDEPGVNAFVTNIPPKSENEPLGVASTEVTTTSSSLTWSSTRAALGTKGARECSESVCS